MSGEARTPARKRRSPSEVPTASPFANDPLWQFLTGLRGVVVGSERAIEEFERRAARAAHGTELLTRLVDLGVDTALFVNDPNPPLRRKKVADAAAPAV